MSYVVHVDRTLSSDGNLLAGAIDASVVKRLNIVDRGKVAGRQEMTAGNMRGEMWVNSVR